MQGVFIYNPQIFYCAYLCHGEFCQYAIISLISINLLQKYQEERVPAVLGNYRVAMLTCIDMREY